ncbi:MAG TPA: site-specific DNA-methyltransferase [Ferruginibacter sp.]|nr:site-specific DNA-methyltransferase [Ferruginibacter sp.]
MNKTDLIQKVKALDGLSQDERAYLINLVNTKKKYGLVWEDKPEEVEEQLRENLPVLQEVKDKAIVNGEDYPNHILIEGDNLHALTALSFTHEGKIDVIYIDPPYNTGKATEFKYNDKYVDEEDGFRHSKWLSFMNKRLRLAHRLLSENGIIIINIDDHEVSQLNLLCNEIFNQNQNPKNSNQLGLLVWDLGTGTSAGHFTRTNEFIIVFAKDKKAIPNFSGGEGIIDDRAQKKIGIKNPASEFEFKAGTKFEAPDDFELTDKWGGTEETTLIEGRMRCKNGKLVENVTLSAGWTQKNQMKSFFDGQDTIDSKGQKVIEFYFKENGKIYCRKDRSILNPPSVLREIATTKQGSSLLKNMFNGEEPIQFVKPIQLIQYFLELLPKNIQVLDFFAGSGTTLHATMQLNSEDEGSRKCIIITNNENNICEEVTYERNKKAICGYSNLKGEAIEGLSANNLRYYKSEFVSRDTSLKNRRELTQLATELLCIKEDCYTEQKIKIKQAKLFANARVTLLILFDDHIIPDAVELIKEMEAKEIKVYVFSMGSDPYTEDFAEVLDKVTLCALPDAIYKAYQNVLPKKKRTVPLMEEVSETPTNENGEQLSIL